MPSKDKKSGDKAKINKLRRQTKESARRLLDKQSRNKQEEERLARLQEALEKNDDEIEEVVDDMDLDGELDNDEKKEDELDNGKKEAEPSTDKKEDEPSEAKTEPDKKKEDEPSQAKIDLGQKEIEPDSTEKPSVQNNTDNKGHSMKPGKKVMIKEEVTSDDGALFVVPSVESHEDSEDNEEMPEDPELGTALVSAESPESNEEFETLGWTKTFSINRYGPKNAGVFRLERKNQKDYGKPLDECVSNKAYGYGRAIDEAGQWKYQKDSHVKGIFGVAWKHDHSLDRSGNVELMNPNNSIYEKKKNGSKKQPMTNTYVLLVWTIDGARYKSWETRTVIRRLWGNESEADDAIYKAARTQERRRGELESGIRKAASRTPSVALDRATTPPRQTTPARHTPRASPVIPRRDFSEILKELRTEFLDFFGVDSVAELQPDDQVVLREELHARRAALAA